MGMDTIPGIDPMENPPQSPLAGLDPADLLKQGAAEDTLMDSAWLQWGSSGGGVGPSRASKKRQSQLQRRSEMMRKSGCDVGGGVVQLD